MTTTSPLLHTFLQAQPTHLIPTTLRFGGYSCFAKIYEEGTFLHKTNNTTTAKHPDNIYRTSKLYTQLKRMSLLKQQFSTSHGQKTYNLHQISSNLSSICAHIWPLFHQVDKDPRLFMALTVSFQKSSQTETWNLLSPEV